jgi:hypothetical protein
MNLIIWKLVKVDWDTEVDGCIYTPDELCIPTEVLVPVSLLDMDDETAVSDWLSDTIGYCVNSWKFAVDEDVMRVAMSLYTPEQLAEIYETEVVDSTCSKYGCSVTVEKSCNEITCRGCLWNKIRSTPTVAQGLAALHENVKCE